MIGTRFRDTNYSVTQDGKAVLDMESLMASMKEGYKRAYFAKGSYKQKGGNK